MNIRLTIPAKRQYDPRIKVWKISSKELKITSYGKTKEQARDMFQAECIRRIQEAPPRKVTLAKLGAKPAVKPAC